MYNAVQLSTSGTIEDFPRYGRYSTQTKQALSHEVVPRCFQYAGQWATTPRAAVTPDRGRTAAPGALFRGSGSASAMLSNLASYFLLPPFPFLLSPRIPSILSIVETARCFHGFKERP